MILVGFVDLAEQKSKHQSASNHKLFDVEDAYGMVGEGAK